MSASATDLRDEIISKSRAGVGLREIEETVIERSALDEDEQAALWLLAWSLPTTSHSLRRHAAHRHPPARLGETQRPGP
jgi:hypothetical protein